ncbi:MAG: hypothetical protein WCT50_00710 [Patescibacteria group bacterium]
MKQIRHFLENGKFDFSKVFRQILIIFVFIVIFLILLATGNIIFLLQAFGWLENHVRAYTGFDMLLAKGISAFLLAGILLLPIGGFILSFFPVPQKNKKIKRVSVIVVFAALCVASYFSSQNVFFNPDTGKPMKYYSISPNGEYRFYSSEGYDPMTGDELKEINKEVVLKYMTQSGLAKNAKPNESSLSGLEIEAAVYSVKFTNNTRETLFLCISERLNRHTDDLLIKKMISGDSVIIKLLEGEHVFGFLNIDGKSLRLSFNYYAGFIRGCGSDARAVINGQTYYLNDSYLLKIYPKDGLSVYLKDGLCAYSKDNDVYRIYKQLDSIKCQFE